MLEGGTMNQVLDDINFDNYGGFEMIYNYLHQYEDKISYNFTFTEWIKLSANNNINEL